MELTDEENVDFISLWENEPVLYNSNHVDYRDKIKKRTAQKRITENMDVEMAEIEVTGIIKNLRNQLLKEKRKETASIKIILRIH